jgi:hypothetical protein
MTSLILALLLAQQNAPDLNSVLQRATEYVTQYEADLGNLIGSEEYVQTSVWLDNRQPPRVSTRMQRRTASDFLIIQVGPEWAALRKVNRVDGSKVKDVEPAFEDAFDNSAEANAKRLRDMKTESAHYNIGDIRREINLPTFALKVLRKTEVSRFDFERAGSGKIDGIPAWTIRFRERAGRSLVSAAMTRELYSNGTFWVGPRRRVLPSEFEVENPCVKIKGRTVVTYSAGKKVQMLVPGLMIEHYESQYNNIDCRADYSNFRPFEVDVKFEIGAPQP